MRRDLQNEAKPLSPKKMLLRDPGTVKLPEKPRSRALNNFRSNLVTNVLTLIFLPKDT
jgi:hypothetical protein